MTRLERRWLLPPAALVSLGLLAGCGGAGGPDGKAESVLRARMQDPNAAGYAFQIAEGTPSPVMRAILLESLAAPDFDTSLAAAQALVDSDDPAVVEAMRQVFETKRGAVKLHAGIVLARNGDETARAWLLEEVQRGGRLSPEVFALLADTGEKDALVAALQPFLDSDDLPTRNEAYGVLGEIGTAWAVDMLEAGLKKERGEDRVQPIISLGRAGDPESATLIMPYVDSKGLVFASLEALGALGNPEAAGAVEAMLSHEEALVRVYAAAAAWRLGAADAAVPVIEPLASDEDPVVRRNVAEQLEPVTDPRATAILIGMLDDDDVDVRIAAIRALDTREGSDVDDALLGATSDADYRVGAAALVALAKVGGPDAVARIQPLLEAQNPYVSVAAAHAILAIRARTGAAAG